MPSLEDFLGKAPKKDLSNLEKINGTYGCQKCDEDVYEAFFDPEELLIIWTCPQEHESRVQLG